MIPQISLFAILPWSCRLTQTGPPLKARRDFWRAGYMEDCQPQPWVPQASVPLLLVSVVTVSTRLTKQLLLSQSRWDATSWMWAPNYTDGVAEKVVGEVLAELMQDHKVRRDEVIVVTKVGNVLGQQLRHADGVPGMTQVQAELKHCISPAWIEQEINRSLERLQLKCIDCVLLHCPEFETRGSGVDMDEVYARLNAAFRHLETEVARGRIASYGVSAAFFPLRPTEPEHLNLESLIQQLPEDHHFRILQFPLNFAEAQNLTVAHVPRNSDGAAADRERISSVGTLFELARRHGLATLTKSAPGWHLQGGSRGAEVFVPRL